MTVEEIIQKDMEELQSFFVEDIELVAHDLRHTYTQFRLKAIDGVPVKSKILLDFYDDMIYMPLTARQGYAGKLDIFIMGEIFKGKEGCIGRNTITYTNRSYADRAKNKLSMVEFVRSASGFKMHYYNAVSGVLKKVDDAAYAAQRCREHLGRA